VKNEKIPPKENWSVIGQRLTVHGPQQMVIIDKKWCITRIDCRLWTVNRGLLLGQRLTVHCWLSIANCPRSTVNRGSSTLCVYNYNLLSSVDCQPWTISRSTAYGPLSTADCNFWLKLMNYQNWLLTVNRGPLTAINNKFLNNFLLLGILYQKNAYEKN
jgi:hypothetical protein